MKVGELLDRFNFTESHINYVEIKSKYGTKSIHVDSLPYLGKEIKDKEVASIYTLNKPNGYYTSEYLIISIRIWEGEKIDGSNFFNIFSDVEIEVENEHNK